MSSLLVILELFHKIPSTSSSASSSNVIVMNYNSVRGPITLGTESIITGTFKNLS
jgi:hypothetical protein